jgi:hypothetical protein
MRASGCLCILGGLLHLLLLEKQQNTVSDLNEMRSEMEKFLIHHDLEQTLSVCGGKIH